jgi:hypothetical protein
MSPAGSPDNGQSTSRATIADDNQAHQAQLPRVIYEFSQGDDKIEPRLRIQLPRCAFDHALAPSGLAGQDHTELNVGGRKDNISEDEMSGSRIVLCDCSSALLYALARHDANILGNALPNGSPGDGARSLIFRAGTSAESGGSNHMCVPSLFLRGRASPGVVKSAILLPPLTLLLFLSLVPALSFSPRMATMSSSRFSVTKNSIASCSPPSSP